MKLELGSKASEDGGLSPIAKRSRHNISASLSAFASTNAIVPHHRSIASLVNSENCKSDKISAMQQAAPSQHRPTEQLENGTGAVNGHSVPATVEEDDDGYPRARALTSFDHDIIRLIGQYLKFLGFR